MAEDDGSCDGSPYAVGGCAADGDVGPLSRSARRRRQRQRKQAHMTFQGMPTGAVAHPEAMQQQSAQTQIAQQQIAQQQMEQQQQIAQTQIAQQQIAQTHIAHQQQMHEMAQRQAYEMAQHPGYAYPTGSMTLAGPSASWWCPQSYGGCDAQDPHAAVSFSADAGTHVNIASFRSYRHAHV